MKGQRSGPCCHHKCFLKRRPAAAAGPGSFRELYSLCWNVVNPRRQPPLCPGAPAARSGCWDYPKGATGGERTPPPPFSPTASIKLCQLLPLAKPCLRETDLKGPKSAATPLWGYSATSQSGQRRELHPQRSKTTLEVLNESGNRRRFPTLFERMRKNPKPATEMWLKV